MTATAAPAEVVGPSPGRPHASLRSLVDSYHGYHYAVTEPGIHRGLPSTVLTVVLAFNRPLDLGWYGRPETRGEHWALASGLHTAPAEIYHDGVQCGIQLGLTAAGARTLLGVPAGALAAGIVAFDDLVPARLRGWHHHVATQSTWPARYAAVDAVLLRLAAGRADRVPVPRPELAHAWTQLVASRGTAPVAVLAAEIGWSRRHLTSQFGAEFGLSPKQLARVVRFERARGLYTAGQPLAAVAVDAGFSDQAHLTREWRAMSGYSPREWRRAEFPFVQDFGGHDASE